MKLSTGVYYVRRSARNANEGTSSEIAVTSEYREGPLFEPDKFPYEGNQLMQTLVSPGFLSRSRRTPPPVPPPPVIPRYLGGQARVYRGLNAAVGSSAEFFLISPL